MRSSSRRAQWRWCCKHLAEALAFSGALGGVVGQARAEVFQTDWLKTPLPQPVGAAELGLGPAWGYVSTTRSFVDPATGEVTSTPIVYGDYYSPPAFPQFVDGDAFTLNGLFKWRGEQLDPVADAATEPGHFLPGCGFRAELVLHGGSCDVALGWYNFTGDGPPARADIQPLVPKGSTYLNAPGYDLVPLAWDNRDPRDLSLFRWTPKAFSSGDITANPHYAGGEIAFAMLGDPGLACKTDKFSVYEHNPKNAAGVPWVTALLYRSKVDPSAVYLAFEDLPMAADDWRNGGPGQMNDADFNDAVFFISGLGGTATCPEPACREVKCDAGELCVQGACVPASSGSGGANEGGASSASGGAPQPSEAGGATTNQGGGGAGSDTTSEGGGDAPEIAGGAAMASAGSPVIGSHGSGESGSAESESGCSCRVGSRGPMAAAAACLQLTLALLLRRRTRKADSR